MVANKMGNKRMNMSLKMKMSTLIIALSFYSAQCLAVDSKSSDRIDQKRGTSIDLKDKIANSEEYISGKHYLLGGILTTAIGVPIGFSTVLLSNFGDCDPTKQQECERARANATRSGLAIGLVSASIGIPLIVYGIAKKRRAANRLSAAWDSRDLGVSFALLNGITIAGISGNVTASPANCSTDGATGCVTVDGFKSADMTRVTAANIKSGITVAGVAGDYPSATNPLANNTVSPDLTTFGPATPVGAYEFFDSTGNRYSAVVADGGTITPGTTNQSLASAGTLYRAVTVLGDADLTTANVKDTIQIFGVTGSLTGAPANCSAAGQQNCLVTGTWFGGQACGINGSSCYLPAYVATTQPLKAISYDAIDGGKSLMHTTLNLAGVAGTLADCSANNATGCVTTASYKSADWERHCCNTK